MGYPTIHVHAPIRKSVGGDGGRPVVVFDKDERHPGGEAFLAEGDEADVFRTPTIAARLGKGLLVEGRLPKVKDASGKEVPKVDPESLNSLGLEPPTLDALNKAAVASVGQLVAMLEKGDLPKVPGIGPGRVEEIAHRLVLANRIAPPPDPNA